MLVSRGWMTVALICNLVGGILLFFSFQIAPSHFKLVKGIDGSASVCVDGRAVLFSRGGNYLFGGAVPCPEWDRAKPTAEIHVERPSFVYMGFGLTILGFALQSLSVWTQREAVRTVAT